MLFALDPSNQKNPEYVYKKIQNIVNTREYSLLSLMHVIDCFESIHTHSYAWRNPNP